MTCLLPLLAMQTSLWKPIPASDPAKPLLDLVLASQAKPSDLPEGSTYNYIWAQNMMTWMVAERSGLMTTADCTARLNGLLSRVAKWKTHHGFYFDAYNPESGEPTSQNVYFQGWWIWALILTRAAYPEAAANANAILSRLDYDAAGMITADHRYLVADKNAMTGAISYTIQPTGDIAGELRTPVIAYTYLTGDITPWKITGANTFIDVGGQSVLAVWHHFEFDPFYVHSAFPEVGYFQKSYDSLVEGANAYRRANGMTFYATRMEPLEAWNENPATWPNTEHRVAKPWIAWLTDSNAPVLEHAWIPGFGITQLFDNWNFYWGYGDVKSAHEKLVGGSRRGAFTASFSLETLSQAAKPPRLSKLAIYAKSGQDAGPLVVKVNGIEVGRIVSSSSLTKPIEIVPASPLTLLTKNEVRIESLGSGTWQVGAPSSTFRSVHWQDEGHSATEVAPIGLTVVVDGQRSDRENPYAFLCRTAGAYGNYVWKLLAEKTPGEFGRKQVAWVGDYTTDVRYAHVVYNVAATPKTVRYELSPWETKRAWQVVDYDRQTPIASTRSGNTITWMLGPRQTSLLK